MIPQRFLPLLLTGIVLLINACATFPPSRSKALVGTWTNSLGTVWTIKDGGTFEVDLNKDGKPDAWGKYTVDANTITIYEASGKVPKECREPGIYRFHRTANKLHFTLIKDNCKLRMKNVKLDWTRK